MHSSVDQNNTRRLGVAFTPLETRADVIVEAGVLAEEFGFDHFSIAEGWSYDSTHLLAEIARRTERIELVASVLSVYGRSAGTIAMTAATISRLCAKISHRSAGWPFAGSQSSRRRKIGSGPKKTPKLAMPTTAVFLS